jgi:hypothetical protein
MAIPEYNQPEETNYGHSEYQLLVENGLKIMMTNFQPEQRNETPQWQYVILYSTRIPCVHPENPNPNEPRCTRMVIEAIEDLKSICGPGTTFFLYTTDETPLTLEDRNLSPEEKDTLTRKIKTFKNKMKRKKIVWIYPGLKTLRNDTGTLSSK